MARAVALALVLVLAMAAAPGAAAGRAGLRSRGIVTKGGIEGVACTNDEHARFKTIVCKVEEVCECADTVCKLEWCATYVHDWKKKFGACMLLGCEGSEEPAEAPAEEEGPAP